MLGAIQAPDRVSFSKGWAGDLVRHSHTLTKHCYLPGVLQSTGAVLTDVERMFARFVPDEPPLLRAYIDGGQRFGLVERFVSRAPSAGEGLERHVADALRTNRFCLTFNGLTKWSDAFTHLMQSQFVQEIFSRTGLPYGGCDFYSFIGNYGYTPFGVHDDDDHSLLIQLGPGTKTVYIWPREDYIARTGHVFTTTDFASLLPSSNRYDLAPGDLVFIPKGDFHVFDTPEFSVTLGFTIFPLSSAEDIRQIAGTLAPEEERDAYFATAGDYLTRSSAPLTPVLLTDLVAARRAALLSNGSVTTLPRPREKGALHTSVQPGRRYGVPKYHPIQVIQDNGTMSLLARGRIVGLGINKGVRELADFANSRNEFTLDEVSNAMADNWADDATKSIVEMLIQLKGIETDPTFFTPRQLCDDSVS